MALIYAMFPSRLNLVKFIKGQNTPKFTEYLSHMLPSGLKSLEIIIIRLDTNIN